MTDVFYATYYGSTKQYADALAARLGVTAREISDEQAALIDASSADPIIVLSPIHGPSHPGVKFVKELEKAGAAEKRRVALATVGMTLDDVVAAQDPAGELLGNLAGSVERFYLPGRMNYSELNSKHRNIMKGLIAMLRMKPGKSENDQMMIDTYDKDVDRVDLGRLEPIVEWAES
ncbi:flavodoxin domain-containing protein [Corynebacterium sp. P3-F1]|uniref:flavodoxin domain-containing protein n=1 Tax=Corynebacterium sp. P3-F1 TaxID=3059080 RepID=UPI00265D0C6A|nr:flavodoxin domain-containing protein [Corynebacterium sp. P3-F1]WKK60578.1 flavodoxin domain-containing protein [Corynebacterium sp. P3-F1]